jgi:hypothetical protein
LTLIALAFLLQASSDSLNLNDGEFVLRNATTRSWTFNPDHTVKVDAAGDPVQFISGPNGATLTGGTGNAVVTKRSDGTYALTSANLTGSAQVVIDSKAGNSYLLAHGKPVQSTVESRSDLKAETLTLTSQGEDQIVSSPGPLIFADSRSQKGAPAQQTSLTGSRGSVNFRQAGQGGMEQVRAGTIDGPVHYHAVQTDLKGGKPEVTEYDIRADKLVLDFTKPEGTVTAIGHVHWTETGGGFPFTSDDDEAVLHTDPDRQVESITSSGQPSKTVIPLPRDTTTPLKKKRGGR